MITEVPNAMIPRTTFTDPDNGVKWLYFEYDGTYDGYKSMPRVVKMDDVLYMKMSHNSDTMNVAYRQIDRKFVAFKA